MLTFSSQKASRNHKNLLEVPQLASKQVPYEPVYRRRLAKRKYTLFQLTKKLSKCQNAVYNELMLRCALSKDHLYSVAQLSLALWLDFSREAINAAIDNLIARGLIAAMENGRYSRCYSKQLTYYIPINSPDYGVFQEIIASKQVPVACSRQYFTQLMNLYVNINSSYTSSYSREIVYEEKGSAGDARWKKVGYKRGASVRLSHSLPKKMSEEIHEGVNLMPFKTIDSVLQTHDSGAGEHPAPSLESNKTLHLIRFNDLRRENVLAKSGVNLSIFDGNSDQQGVIPTCNVLSQDNLTHGNGSSANSQGSSPLLEEETLSTKSYVSKRVPRLTVVKDEWLEQDGNVAAFKTNNGEQPRLSLGVIEYNKTPEYFALLREISVATQNLNRAIVSAHPDIELYKQHKLKLVAKLQQFKK